MIYKRRYTLPEVLRLKAEGLTNAQIASQFGISGTRVWQLIRREQLRIASAARSAVIRAEIGAVDDLDRKLTLDDLCCVLNLSRRAEAVLRRHLSQQGVAGFSLRDMMDFLIPIVDDAKVVNTGGDDYEDYLRHMPAYRVNRLGRILYAEMIRALSALDCGGAFQAEWTERKRRLRDYLVGSGDFQPYLLRGKNPALR